MTDFSSELTDLEHVIRVLQKRVAFIALQGGNVEAIQTALDRLSRDVDALIAKAQGSITPAQAQSIVDGLTALATKLEAATTA